MDLKCTICALILTLAPAVLFANVIVTNPVEKAVPEASKWWNHQLTLSHAHNFVLKWNNLDSEWLTMEMSGRVKNLEVSYLVMGFSANGKLGNGTDLVLGYVDPDTKEAYLLDLHGVAPAKFAADPTSNYKLLKSVHVDGILTMRFRRKWNTCDSNDYTIDDDTVRLIWGMGSIPADVTLSENKTFESLSFGGSNSTVVQQQGVRSMLLKINSHAYVQFPEEEIPATVGAGETAAATRDSKKVLFMDFRGNNVINGESTKYACGIIKITKPPGVGDDEKYHVIGFRPLLENEAEKRVHHMLLFECRNFPRINNNTNENIFDEEVGKTGVDMFSKEAAKWLQYCNIVTLDWAIGGEGLMFPKNTGMPIDGEYGGTYYIMQIHYDNPEQKSFVDQSGIRVYFDKAREQETAVFSILHRVSIFHLIPPKMSSYTVKAFCSRECNSKVFPQGGITVTNALLHAHKSAIGIIVRHVRNGVELAPIAQDRKYDPSYQEFRSVYPGAKVMPGDELIIECTYDTSARENFTLGGVAASSEMCAAFLQYFPKASISFATSQPEYYSFFSSLGIQDADGEILHASGFPYDASRSKEVNLLDDTLDMRPFTNSINFEPALDQINIYQNSTSSLPHNTTLSSYLAMYDWKTNGKGLQEKIYGGNHYAFCPDVQLEKYITKFPTILKKYETEGSRQC